MQTLACKLWVVCLLVAAGSGSARPTWRSVHSGSGPSQPKLNPDGTAALSAPLVSLHPGNQPLQDVGDGSNGPTCLVPLYNKPIPMPADYVWLSNPQTRRMAQANHGHPSRLRVALDRYRKLPAGENFTISFIGGSITAGQGAADGKAFPWWAEDILHAAMGPNVKIHNGAVPGTLSSYMSVCHNMHVPKESDIVFVEYAVNDDYMAMPVMDNNVRRPFERLIRKLLTYPKRPAVVLVHSFVWHRINVPSGIYWPSSERDFHEFALYYGLPELSVKAAAWKLMKDGVHGFMVDQTRANHVGGKRPASEDEQLKGRVFYWDVFHPDGQTGHKFMAEMTAQALLDALAGVDREPVTETDQAQVAEDLPPPMLPNNWQSLSDRCFVGLGFQNVVTEHAGWEYKDEGKDASKPKLGYISTQPGAVLRIKMSTMTTSDKQDLPVTVELSYLKSYVNMGMASVACEVGCTCERTTINGYHLDKNSQLYLHEFKASQHADCVIAITVMPETETGQHKVKIAGIVVSEEGGEGGIQNFGAVQMVMEGANKDKGGTFDIREWAKQDPVEIPAGR